MADVIEFPVLERPSRPGPIVPRRGGSAEIVIFPGVRIERWTSIVPTPPETPRAKRKLKRPALTD
ncbi:MAG TPA: hypothetical protein PK264_02465 [Hyphomicrobiaceae bacterium]|nr:hypothetical protein [Hyphomicrobiaceae bacterium]